MTVGLAHDQRGVHMSRFVEVLDASAGDISHRGFREMLAATRVATRLRALPDHDAVPVLPRP